MPRKKSEELGLIPSSKALASRRAYAKNTAVRIEASSKWQKRNPAKHCASNTAFRKKVLERLAGRPRPKKCDICNKVGLVHFDHCHKNRHFRGWLCFGCNTALGAAKDSAKTLRKLANYLDADKLRDTKNLEKLPVYFEACGQRRQRKRNEKPDNEKI